MESRPKGSLILASVPLSEPLWTQFLTLHNAQKSPMSADFPMPQQGIWIAIDGDLVVGCCIYDTDGPLLMAEHLVSNPKFTYRVRFAAFNLALDLLRGFATARSKWIVAHPSSKGLGRYLMKRGFAFKHVVTLVAPPGLSTMLATGALRAQKRKGKL